MENGIFVESGSTEKIFEKPENPYTQKLISSIPGHKAKK
jgi:ABC-type oligopeptide transport system ATPase subunit